MSLASAGTIGSQEPLNEEGTKAYSLNCADTGGDCPGQFTTESKEELIKHVELHVTEPHTAWS